MELAIIAKACLGDRLAHGGLLRVAFAGLRSGPRLGRAQSRVVASEP